MKLHLSTICKKPSVGVGIQKPGWNSAIAILPEAMSHLRLLNYVWQEYQRVFKIFRRVFMRLYLALTMTLLAFITEERCRLCRRYIDVLGWLGSDKFDVSRPSKLSRSDENCVAICQDCWKQIVCSEPISSRFVLNQTIDGQSQAPNAKESPSEFVVLSGIDYSETIKKLMRHFKYDGDTIIDLPFAELMIRAMTVYSHSLRASLEPKELESKTDWTGSGSKFCQLSRSGCNSNLLLVPVPLHVSRQKERGYNQAALLAQRIRKYTRIRICERALSRTKSTRPQNKLSKTARKENLTGAFVCSRKLVANKDIILIDDVCTSGATLLGCARELYRCGARSVLGLTVARAILVKGGDASSS